MANRNFANSRIYTGHVMPVLIDGSVSIGALGAVSNLKGPYVKSVTRLAAGVFQIQLQDNFNKVYSVQAMLQSPVSGSSVDPSTLLVGDLVQIDVVGSTDWSAIGLPSGVTAAVGQAFVMTAVPSASTSRVKAVGNSGIAKVEVVGNPNLMSAPMVANQGAQGAIIMIQCLQAQMPSSTVQGTPIDMIKADPASGSVLQFSIMLSNSSITIQGE